MRPVTAVAVCAMAIGVVPGSARADLLSPECQVFSAPIVTSFFVDGCTSPFGICTAGSIDGGLLGGSTTFAVTDIQPGDSVDQLQYAGELVITTPNGVLTIHDKGVLNQSEATFFEIDQIVSGTGSFENVTGLLFSQGTSNPTGFEGIIAGHICGAGGSNISSR